MCYGHLSLLDYWLTRRLGMAADTLARIFWERVERSADHPAQQFKQGTVWKTTTWREVGETVREVALGLLALGRAKGDGVAFVAARRAACRRVVPGRLRDLHRGLRDGPGLSDLSALPDRLHRERFRRADDHRRGPGAAREGAAGARQDAEPRAHHRHQRLRRPAA